MNLIIAATDGSEAAGRAVAAAADLAKAANAKLLLINVSERELSDAELHLIDRLRVTEGDALEEISRRILSTAKAIAQQHCAGNVETMMGAGDPAKVLIDIINCQRADAIVIGRRGRGQLEGLLLGSVSQKLATHAQCIVIIVP